MPHIVDLWLVHQIIKTFGLQTYFAVDMRARYLNVSIANLGSKNVILLRVYSFTV